MGILKAPRVTTTDRLTIVPASSEIMFDTDLGLYFGGNSSTVGGFPIGLNATPAVSAAYTDPSVLVGTIPSGYRIVNVVVVVSVTFDDPTAQIDIGTVLLPSVLVVPGDVDLTIAGQYSIPTDFLAATSTEIYMTLTSNASVQGSVFAYLEVGV